MARSEQASQRTFRLPRIRGATAMRFIGLAIVLLLPASRQVQAQVFAVTDTPANRQQLERSVQYIMSLSDQQVIDTVPIESGGIFFTSCPNCNYGAEESGCFGDTWDPRHPKQIVCRGCGAVYPNNPKYPDDKFIEVDAPGGHKHRFYYYERPDGYRFFFRAHADYWAREYLEARAGELGDLYRLTSDDRYARRAALILNRFAEVYPGYVYRYDYPFEQKVFAPYTQNRIPGVAQDYRTSRWSWWAYKDISLGLLRAYDGIEDWPAWTTFADGRARQRIENDLFIPMVEFVLGYSDDLGNMSMYLWRCAITGGRVLRRPEWVHECVRRYEKLLATRFLYDGHWMETADAYAQQTQSGLEVVMRTANGYSDPPGYADAVDGSRFDDLDLRRLAPGYDLAEQAFEAARFPDNRLLPVNDTWAVPGETSYGSGGSSSPRDRMQPLLLPASGLAVLGGGEGHHQVHAYLNYTMGRHHKHNDALSIGLWANGYELLSDIGYTHTNCRLQWAEATMSHNTVVVNGINSDEDPSYRGHQLRAFAADPHGFQLASVEAGTAYPNVASLYRRTLALVGADSRDAYLIDVFQVNGGHQHDYLLHGCRDADSTTAVAGALLEQFDGTLLNPGVEFAPPQSGDAPNPPGFGFGFIRSLRRGAVQGDLTLDFRLAEHPDIGTRTLMTALADATLFVGEAPDVRRAREINGDVYKTSAPVFCIRCQGENLHSTFIATHEPVNGEPKIRAIAAQQTSGALLLRIDRGELGVDWFVMALDDWAEAEFGTSLGPLRFSGRFGLARSDSQGRVCAAWLVDGGLLALGDRKLGPAGRWIGNVTGYDQEVRPDGAHGFFDVDEPFRPAHPYLLLLHFADGTIWPFNVVAVEPIPGGTRVHVNETPAFQVGGGKTRLTAYPQREIAGEALAVVMPDTVAAEWPPPDRVGGP